MQNISRRALNLAGPIGDPYNGPNTKRAFNKRRMDEPFSAIAAVIAGTASTAVVIAAVGEVGLALSVVGAATGNKKLMKVGAVMGLVSGIGAIANSAFGAATAGAETVAASGVGDALAEGALEVSDDFLANGMGAAQATDMAASATELSSAAAGLSDVADTASAIAPDAATSALPTQAQTFDPTAASAVGTPAGPPVDLAPATYQPAAPYTPPADYVAPELIQPADTASAAIGASPEAAAQAGAGTASNDLLDSTLGSGTQYGRTGAGAESLNGQSYFDKLTGYLKSEKGLNTAMQLGAGALSGISKSISDDRMYQLQKEALDLRKAQTQYGNDQVKVAGIINKARAA